MIKIIRNNYTNSYSSVWVDQRNCQGVASYVVVKPQLAGCINNYALVNNGYVMRSNFQLENSV